MHFIAGICSFVTQFPLQYWDKLVDQATINLNMMHALREKTKIPMHMNMFEYLNNNVMQLVPPVSEVLFPHHPLIIDFLFHKLQHMLQILFILHSYLGHPGAQ